MDPLIIDLIRQFVVMVVLACVVTAVAFVWRRPAGQNPISAGAIVVVVLMAAVFMLVVSLVAQAVLGITPVSLGTTAAVARFVVPLAAGFWFAQSRLKVIRASAGQP